VGVLFGLLGVGILGLAQVVGVDMGACATLLGAIVVGVWALLSGFLHWDGLADTADGLAARGSSERRLEAMADARVGGVGVAAVVMLALLQVGAVAALADKGAIWAVLLAPVLGRAAATVAAWSLPPARHEGLAASVSGRPFASEVLWAAVTVVATSLWALAAAASMGPSRGAWAALAAIAGGLAVVVVGARALARPIGGTTGDTLGASVLLVETTVLAFAALVA
jgi:adenosylcobinamide-GDP ribazoletransferase